MGLPENVVGVVEDVEGAAEDVMGKISPQNMKILDDGKKGSSGPTINVT